MVQKRGRKKKSQKGGFLPAGVVAAATTAHTLAQKYKPISAIDDFLTSRNLKSDGKSTLGKIVNAGLSFGRNVLGYGQNGGAQLSRPDGSQVWMSPQTGLNQINSGSGKKRGRMIKY